MAKKKEEVEQAKTKKSENEPSSKRKTTQKKQAQYEFLDTSKDHSGLDKSGVTECIKEQDKDVVIKKENGKKKKIIVASILSGALLAGAVGGGILLFSNKSTNLVYNVDGKRYELEIRNASDLLGVQAPKLEGYDFAGWYLDEACVQKIEKDQVFKNNTVVYPKYVPKICDVEYLANDGTGESVVQDVVFNTEYNIADNTFTRENYIFMGWSTDADSHYTDENIIRVGDSRTLVTEGIKYYAVWKGVDRNITYSASEIRVNGEVYTFTNTTCPHGETYTLPTIEGEIANGLDFEMKFAGYIVDGQVYAAGTELTITEDVEITINWTDKDSVLYFNLNLPVGEMAANINPLSFENASQEYLYTDLPEPAALVNYEFKCWNTAIDGSGEDYNVGDNFTTTAQSNILYAIWEGKARTINLYNQGSIEETFNLKYGETIDLPEYTLTDYTFIGFNDKSDYTGNVYTISLDILFEEEVINLYAQYERNQITITFNANGGEGTLEPIEVNTNEVYTFDSDAIEIHRSSMIRQYYTFVGWSEDPNALTTEASFSVDVDEVGIVLYAIWEKQESQIMFEGENIETIKLSVSQGEKVYAPNLPSEQCYYDDNGVRYYFAGWSDTEGATKPNVYINETELTVEDALKTYHAVYMPASDCLEYTLDSDTDTYRVSFDTSSTITEEDYMLIIPNTYNGKDVTAIKSVYDYSGHDLIKRVIVADGVNISYALNGMSNLKSIKLPASFSSIEEGAFGGLGALETIIVDDGNTKYDSRNNCNAIIDTATNTLVLGCKNTVIPEGVTSIGFRAFYETDGPSSIEIPASVTSIGLLAFEGCDELKTITFAEGCKLTSIGDYAFRSCSSLTNMYIPASVTSIGDIFDDGLKLESIIVEEGNTVYDSRNNCNALIETATNTLLMGCKNTVIPEGVEIIGAYALYNQGLTRVEIPASVTSIHRYALRGSKNVFETIIVDEDNKTYDSRNNCNALIETATNTLLLGCQNTVIPEGVEIIGDEAFINCKGLTTLEIPASVTSIGMFYGFDGCVNITTIIVDEDNKTYDSRNNCNALIETATNELLLGCQNTVIPEGVVRIGDAFKNCEELTTIEIPASVTSIYIDTFYRFKNITTIIVDEDNKTYDSRNNCNALIETATNTLLLGCQNTVIPEGVEIIGDRAFSGCTGLTTLEIPASVTSISGGAFGGCTGLTTLEIPASVTSISRGAFGGCTGLTTITFAEGSQLTSIDQSAFENCTSLISIEIPASVTSIGWYAFRYCTSLTTVTFAEGSQLTSIDWEAFKNCTSLTSIEIPASVTSIGNYVFENCTALESIIVEEGNTVYDSRNNCNAIIETATNELLLGCQNTVIPEGVTSIVFRAFRYCTSLTSIEIPASVTSIGRYAFEGCTGLKTVIFNAETPINLGSSCLLDDATIIYVPKGTLDAYKAAYSDYADIIFEKE